MGGLITVVGNSGVGKTTFVQQLCREAGYVLATEKLEERPFQELFSSSPQSYALANQIDFLVYRAEQEIEIRSGDVPGVQDGGLEEDFYLFTRLFHQKGYLSGNEFEICERLFRFTRELLPPPDLIVWLQAPLAEIADRFKKRNRKLEIADIKDLEAMDELLKAWLDPPGSIPQIKIDTAQDNKGYSKSVQKVLKTIENLD